jgi:hypothetical protein
MLPLLVPLAIQIAPAIAKWLFGDDAEKTVQQVGAVVSSVTGVADPHTPDGIAAVEAVLQGKPELAMQIQVQLAQLAATREAEANRADEVRRTAELAALQASIADTANARKQTVDLAASKSAIAWGAPIISFIVLVSFGVMAWLVMWRALPPGSESLAANIEHTFELLSVSVVAYWCGSSAGSARKDGTISQQSQALASSTPPA